MLDCTAEIDSVPSAREIATSVVIPFNALSQIQEREAVGRIPWAGPLLLVSARSVLWLTLQCLLALILLALHRPSPFQTAGQWWIVYGTLSDLCCLLGMRYFARKEGIRLRDLIGPIRLRWGRDIFLGLGILILSFPLFIAGGYLAAWVSYGSMAAVPMELVWQRHTLPLWATVYSLTVWWIIQSATEEMTYQGYALPRLEALTGRTWIALSIVGFWWALQHCMIPFVPDWRYVTYRFLMMLPVLVMMMLIYLRIRRLSPLILAHWPMDLAGAIMTGIR
jgi:hypothetical protein